MFNKSFKTLSTPEYLASAPVPNFVNEHRLEPGFHVLVDLDGDSRFGLKFAVDIATNRTRIALHRGGARVALLVSKAKWPSGFPDHSLWSPDANVRGQIHVESIDPNTRELAQDLLERLARDVRPDVIVIDAFNPVRRPTGMTIEALTDNWARAKGVWVFGIITN